MRLAIMQPYYMPYIGYFQLVAAVDQFIVYDNIKYTKKGWINRNRMLQNGRDVMFSLHLKSGSDSLDVCDRELAEDFSKDKLLNKFKGAYWRAPYFEQAFPLLEQIVKYADVNLFRYLHHSIIRTCEYLGITTQIKISSSIAIDHSLKGQDKVIALCKEAGATKYINAIGGLELYSKDVFREQGVELNFIKSKPFSYAQLGGEFVPWLSIIDVMMFNSQEQIRLAIREGYELV